MLPQPGDTVCAGVDLGLRSDSSALVIVHKRQEKLIVAEILELRPKPGEPLKPSVVCGRFAERMAAHGAQYAVGDAHYRESFLEAIVDKNLTVVSAPAKPAEAYVRARSLMREGRVCLPSNRRLIQQLSEVEGRPTSGGGLSISNPRWATGGHGDLVSAFVLAVWQLGGELKPDDRPAKGTREAIQAEERSILDRRLRQADERRNGDVWTQMSKTGDSDGWDWGDFG